MPAQSLKALHADYSKDADSKPRTDEEKLGGFKPEVQHPWIQ